MTWPMSAKGSAALLVIALAGAAACDPVHSQAIDDLGDEAPGVRRGPGHRPGQPCIVCHDGSLGSPRGFSVAGTIFVDQTFTDPLSADWAVGATVTMVDFAGRTYTTEAVDHGNFYVTPQEFQPTYPMTVSVTYQGTTVKMTSLVGRDGSCAGCHVLPKAGAPQPSPTSPGPVYIPADGVAP